MKVEKIGFRIRISMIRVTVSVMVRASCQHLQQWCIGDAD